jgi:hypothetical protein
MDPELTAGSNLVELLLPLTEGLCEKAIIAVIPILGLI